MTDLRPTIIPKSDQLNSDDLIGATRTITVTKVSLRAEADQPIAIGFEGDAGKPFLPCKSMRRVLVTLWGPDGNAYSGRSMTLYRDEKVMFGGMAVGGIRISHMSHIDKEVTMALTATRANRKPFTVRPLVAQKSAPPEPAPVNEEGADASDYADLLEAEIGNAREPEELARHMNAAMKTAEWKALKAADTRRAADLKDKATKKVAALKGLEEEVVG